MARFILLRFQFLMGIFRSNNLIRYNIIVGFDILRPTASCGSILIVVYGRREVSYMWGNRAYAYPKGNCDQTREMVN